MQCANHFLHKWSSLLYLLISLVATNLCQLFERISIVENSPVNTVLTDLRSVLVKHGEHRLSPNASVYASQQEAFWPFSLDDFKVRLVRPLDREAICPVRQHHHPTSRPSRARMCTDDQGDDECCQLLHINFAPSPIDLPKSLFLKVVIIDVNDNTPSFPHIHTPYALIKEDQLIGERIWLPQASDLDSQLFSVTEYRLVNWMHGNQSHFQLGISSNALEDSDNRPNHPYLLITGPLDRESCELYAFTLLAVDGGGGASSSVDSSKALTGSVSIVIKVTDINDNAPQFDRPTYELVVQENDLHFRLIEFSIEDADIGENGRLSINVIDPSQSPSSASNLFRVNLQLKQTELVKQNTNYHTRPTKSHYKGTLQLIDKIDAERHPSTLHLSLVASDHGHPALRSTADLTVSIINVNDNAPQLTFLSQGKRINDGRLSLTEGLQATPIRAVVALLHVTDADSPLGQLRCQLIRESDAFALEETGGDGITSTISSDNWTYERQKVGPTSRSIPTPLYRQFVLRSKVELDREKKAYFLVMVECSDVEGINALATNASLHISINDVNDNPPQFNRQVYHGHLGENVASGEVQFQSPPLVTDADLGPNSLVSFIIRDISSPTSSNADNSSAFFRVDSTSGRLWSLQPLDCEIRREYSLLLTATDSGSKRLSSSATVIVAVDDANDNAPQFVDGHYAFTVEENAPGGTELGRVEAVDKDVTPANQAVNYRLKGPSEDTHLISIDRTSGVVRTRRPIDRESRSAISLLVVAENQTPFHPSTTFHNQPIRRSQLVASVETSLLITILNVNDNKPVFSVIKPHSSHITFVWEQLPASINNGSISNNKSQPISEHQPVCESLPYQVTDKDVQEVNAALASTGGECCRLELANDYDGLFSLMPEASNVLCVMYRPKSPQSYKLTLIARDGEGEDSLTSQIQFTAVIRSDPNSHLDLSRSKRPTGKSGTRDTRLDHPSLTTGDNEDGSRGLFRGPPVEGHLAYNSRDPSFTADSPHRPITSQGQQTIVVVVMASVAGVLCVLLVIAVLLARRCLFEPKEPPSDQESHTGNEGRQKSIPSLASSPSRALHNYSLRDFTPRLVPSTQPDNNIYYPINTMSSHRPPGGNNLEQHTYTISPSALNDLVGVDTSRPLSPVNNYLLQPNGNSTLLNSNSPRRFHQQQTVSTINARLPPPGPQSRRCHPTYTTNYDTVSSHCLKSTPTPNDNNVDTLMLLNKVSPSSVRCRTPTGAKFAEKSSDFSCDCVDSTKKTSLIMSPTTGVRNVISSSLSSDHLNQAASTGGDQGVHFTRLSRTDSQRSGYFPTSFV